MAWRIILSFKYSLSCLPHPLFSLSIFYQVQVFSNGIMQFRTSNSAPNASISFKPFDCKIAGILLTINIMPSLMLCLCHRAFPLCDALSLSSKTSSRSNNDIFFQPLPKQFNLSLWFFSKIVKFCHQGEGICPCYPSTQLLILQIKVSAPSVTFFATIQKLHPCWYLSVIINVIDVF